MKFTDEQIEELEGVYIQAWHSGEIGGQLKGIRAIAEHVAAPLEAKIAELERQIELAQRLHAVEVRAKDARIATLTTACEAAIARIVPVASYEKGASVVAILRAALEGK